MYFTEMMIYMFWNHKNLAGYLNSQYFRFIVLDKAENLDEDEKDIISDNIAISFY